MPGGESSLQQRLEIGALTVLYVIDVPGPRRRVLNPPFQAEEAPCLVDIAGLGRDDEDGIDPLHRHDADDAGERAFALGLQDLFQFAGDLLRAALVGGKESIGLTGQRIDVEGADQPKQGLSDRRVAADDQRVAARFGGDLAALGDIRFEHLDQILRRGIAQRHDLGA